MGVDIQTYSVTFTSDVLTSEDAPSPSHQVYIYTPNFFLSFHICFNQNEEKTPRGPNI